MTSLRKCHGEKPTLMRHSLAYNVNFNFIAFKPQNYRKNLNTSETLDSEVNVKN